jgi:hypothetical protein
MLATATLGACGTTSRQATPGTDGPDWVKLPDNRSYVQIPAKFKRYKVDPYRIDKLDLGAARVDGIKRDPNWAIVFDRAERPDVKHFDEERPKSLVGRVAYYEFPKDWQTGPRFRDSLNLAALRSFPFPDGIDPIAEFNNGKPETEIISYTETGRPDGIHGIHVRFNQQQSEGKWITVDQQAYTNSNTDKLFVLEMKCSSTCFKTEYDAVKKISSSFIVQK